MSKPSQAKVLLVDDDPANRLALRAVLEGLDLILVEAKSGEEAVRQLLESQFAVILLDVQMPGLDGFETARRIRSREETRHTPIIFQTAFEADRATVERAYALGAVDFLVKPLLPGALRAKVTSFVELFKQRRQIEENAAELRASEERFRLLVDGTADHAIYMLDPTGRVVSWNPGAERIKQYRADEIIGRHFACFYSAEDVEARKPQRELEVATAEGKYEEEGWRVRKDGTKFWAMVVITALRDDAGKVQGFSKVTRDITIRKQAEENARRLLEEETARRAAEQYAQVIEAQREQLRVTLTSIGDGVITTDAEGRVTLLNPVAETLMGWTTEEAAGRPLETIFPIVNEVTRQPVENPVAKVIATGQIVGLANHTVLIARDGTERPIDDSAAPIRDRHGTVIGVVLVFRDVSSRRRDEKERLRRIEQLVETEERTSSIVNNVLDGIITIDERGAVQSFNPAAERLFGYSAPEVIGQNVKVLMPEPYRLEHDGYIANYLRSGDAKIIGIGREVEGRRKNGSTFPMDLAVGEFRLGERRYFTGIVRDITERKRAEEEVHRLNQELQRGLDELQTVLKVLPVGLAIAHDSDCRRITLNPYMSDLLGVPVGANASLSAPPGERPTGYTNYRDGKEVLPDELPMQVACTGAEVRDFEVDVVRPGRDSLKLLCYARPLFDGEGRVRGGVGAFLDITQLKKVEQALREADHRKDEFLATLAHELRNPLAPLRNALELLRRRSGNAALIEQARSIMERQVGQMVRLVDDLLDVSRISHGKVELRKVRVDLGEVLRNAVETSRPLIDGSGHELTVAQAPAPVYVDADPVRLAQVFSNLLNNAARYTEAGGHIRLAVERQGSDVLVSVKDNGIGIAAEMLPRIFEMFSQATPALERSQSGLGIGLSLVKGLVELHGGRVEVYSDGPGRGSEFVVRLPVVVEKQVQEVQPQGDDEPNVAKRRILIVDDLKDSADSLAMLLRMSSHEVHTAYDGEQAVIAAEKFKPEVVLLDIGMPKLNGYDACRRIREKPWGKDIFLVALTGWGQDDDRRRTEEAGFNGHLVKPVNARDLMKVLAQFQVTAE